MSTSNHTPRPNIHTCIHTSPSFLTHSGRLGIHKFPLTVTHHFAREHRARMQFVMLLAYSFAVPPNLRSFLSPSFPLSFHPFMHPSVCPSFLQEVCVATLFGYGLCLLQLSPRPCKQVDSRGEGDCKCRFVNTLSHIPRLMTRTATAGDSGKLLLLLLSVC